MKPVVITTNDGSSSLYQPSIDETYHSKHGALTESVHVFMKNGLYERLSFDDITEVNVLEVGFGTGLNALLAIITCLNRKINLSYSGLEPFPLDQETINTLNYTELLSHPDAKTWFDWMHQLQWDKSETKDNITVNKVRATIESFETEKKFDVVFFDAFAPEKQPELWTPVIYKKIFGLMNELGIMTTYCAKGQVKRDLLNNGFMVEGLQGAPGKREMIRATKPPQKSKTESGVTQ